MIFFYYLYFVQFHIDISVGFGIKWDLDMFSFRFIHEHASTVFFQSYFKIYKKNKVQVTRNV